MLLFPNNEIDKMFQYERNHKAVPLKTQSQFVRAYILYKFNRQLKKLQRPVIKQSSKLFSILQIITYSQILNSMLSVALVQRKNQCAQKFY